MALYSRAGADEPNDKPLPSLPSPTLTNPDLVLPNDGFSNHFTSPARTMRHGYANRDRADPYEDRQTTPTGGQERRGFASRKMMLARGHSGNADDNVAMASSPLLHDRLTVSNNNERRGSNSSMDSEEMARLPEFLQKYRNVDMTDDDTTDIDTKSYTEQRRAKEEEEQVSALLSQRAEEILANAKKRLNLMEGNLRGARDLVAPLTAANLKRATSLSYGSSPTSYIHRRLESYDADPYNPSRKMLHSQASSPIMRQDYLGHARTGSDMDLERPHTSMSKTRFPVRTSGSAAPSPSTSWNANLRSSRSHDSFGISKLIIPDDNKKVRVKTSPDSSLEPVSEDDGQRHIETSYRNSFRAPEVVPIGLGVSHLASSSISGSSTSDDIRDQMASLKGRISSLKARAQEDSMRRSSPHSPHNISPFSDFTQEPQEPWYGQSNGQSSPNRSQQAWLTTTPATGSRNAFAEQAARQRMTTKSNGSSSPGSGYNKYEDTHNRQAGDGPNHAFSQHHYKGSADMPGAYIDNDLEEPSSDEYEDETVYDDGTVNAQEQEEDYDDDEEDDEEDEEGEGESIYEDAEFEEEAIPHEEREDAFDYEHFFLHSAMGSYNSGRMSSDSETSSISSTETARAPTQTQQDLDVEDELEEVPRSGTPDALRQIETRLQHQHGRTISTESMSTLNTFATADENGFMSRSTSRLDWPDEEAPRSGNTADVKSATHTVAEHDDSSDRADSGVGGLPQAGRGTTSKQAVNAQSAVSAPSSPDTAVDADPNATVLRALLDPVGKSLGAKDQVIVYELIESLRRVCVRLQDEDESQYESRVLRRRLDDARRTLDGLGSLEYHA